MNVVDSSGWLEYFANGANTDFFAPAIEDIANLLVPSITLCIVREYDIVKIVIDTDSNIALEAARISADEKLPMAGSLVLATARLHQAILWTQDIDLKDFINVRCVAK